MNGRFPGLLVVKIGGSLGGAGELCAWLRLLENSPVPNVIVPGGGPFADAVRAAQGRIGYGDVTAHEMAMLAMTQFGVALASLCQRAVLVSDRREIAAALARKALPVWSPGRMALADSSISASWDVTSDSLAAWLAGTLGAARLLLVKQADPATTHLAKLAGQGVVDPEFGGFLARSGARGWIAGPADLALAEYRLGRGEVPGRGIQLSPQPDLA